MTCFLLSWWMGSSNREWVRICVHSYIQSFLRSVFVRCHDLELERPTIKTYIHSSRVVSQINFFCSLSHIFLRSLLCCSRFDFKKFVYKKNTKNTFSYSEETVNKKKQKRNFECNFSQECLIYSLMVTGFRTNMTNLWIRFEIVVKYKKIELFLWQKICTQNCIKF